MRPLNTDPSHRENGDTREDQVLSCITEDGTEDVDRSFRTGLQLARRKKTLAQARENSVAQRLGVLIKESLKEASDNEREPEFSRNFEIVRIPEAKPFIEERQPVAKRSRLPILRALINEKVNPRICNAGATRAPIHRWLVLGSCTTLLTFTYLHWVKGSERTALPFDSGSEDSVNSKAVTVVEETRGLDIPLISCRYQERDCGNKPPVEVAAIKKLSNDGNDLRPYYAGHGHSRGHAAISAERAAAVMIWRTKSAP